MVLSVSSASVGEDLQRHEAVGAAARLVHRSEQVGRGEDVFERDLEEQLLGRELPVEPARDGIVIVAAARDRVLEDRRVRGQSR